MESKDEVNDLPDENAEEVQAKKKKTLPKSRKVLPPPDKDTFRLLVASDEHLGYLEGDPTREEDSFRAFEEIFQIAKDNEVDFILLGGDLFHENRPSRQTLYKTMRTLRKYCMGDKTINFQVVSDQAVNFPDSGVVNYEDPNFNVSMPVFAIHGNHDDPAGAGGFSAMDLLNSCNLVNYFGKADRVDEIENYPILMKKGITNLALYGLGNIRDERLHRTFKSNKVKWVRPAQQKDEWFNLCVIHQNRIKHSATQKNFIAENMLPSFLDMVIWGHEHECRIDPEESVESGFYVCQPGSSVATSLSPGEAVAKQVGIIEIHTDKYRIVAVPLRSVRPFNMTDVVLANELDASNDKDRTPEAVESVLKAKVDELVAKANENFVPSDLDHLKMPLPLIRIRVDYTGNFPKINIQRFGQQFVGTVANCEDILLFFKQRKQAGKKEKTGEVQPEEDTDLLLATGDVDSTPPIHDLVSNIIKEANKGLHILSGNRLAEAVQAFVDKKDTNSISDFLSESIKDMQLELRSEKAENKGDIESLVQKKYKRKEAEERVDKRVGKPVVASSRPSESKESELKDDFDAEEQRLENETEALMADPRNSRVMEEKDGDGDWAPSGSDDDKPDEFDEDQEATKTKRKPAAKAKSKPASSSSRGRGRGRGRGTAAAGRGSGRTAAKPRKKKNAESDDEEPAPKRRAARPKTSVSYQDMEDDDVVEIEDEPKASSSSKRSRAVNDSGADAKKSWGAAKKAKAKS